MDNLTTILLQIYCHGQVRWWKNLQNRWTYNEVIGTKADCLMLPMWPLLTALMLTHWFSTNIKLSKTDFNSLTDWHHRLLTDRWSCENTVCHDIFFFVTAGCIQSVILWDILYGSGEYLSISKLNNANITSEKVFFNNGFEWLNLACLFAILLSWARLFSNTDIWQGGVPARVSCGTIFIDYFNAVVQRVERWTVINRSRVQILLEA